MEKKIIACYLEDQEDAEDVLVNKWKRALSNSKEFKQYHGQSITESKSPHKKAAQPLTSNLCLKSQELSDQPHWPQSDALDKELAEDISNTRSLEGHILNSKQPERQNIIKLSDLLRYMCEYLTDNELLQFRLIDTNTYEEITKSCLNHNRICLRRLNNVLNEHFKRLIIIFHKQIRSALERDSQKEISNSGPIKFTYQNKEDLIFIKLLNETFSDTLQETRKAYIEYYLKNISKLGKTYKSMFITYIETLENKFDRKRTLPVIAIGC